MATGGTGYYLTYTCKVGDKSLPISDFLKITSNVITATATDNALDTPYNIACTVKDSYGKVSKEITFNVIFELNPKIDPIVYREKIEIFKTYPPLTYNVVSKQDLASVVLDGGKDLATAAIPAGQTK